VVLSNVLKQILLVFTYKFVGENIVYYFNYLSLQLKYYVPSVQGTYTLQLVMTKYFFFRVRGLYDIYVWIEFSIKFYSFLEGFFVCVYSISHLSIDFFFIEL